MGFFSDCLGKGSRKPKEREHRFGRPPIQMVRNAAETDRGGADRGRPFDLGLEFNDIPQPGAAIHYPPPRPFEPLAPTPYPAMTYPPRRKAGPGEHVGESSTQPYPTSGSRSKNGPPVRELVGKPSTHPYPTSGARSNNGPPAPNSRRPADSKMASSRPFLNDPKVHAEPIFYPQGPSAQPPVRGAAKNQQPDSFMRQNRKDPSKSKIASSRPLPRVTDLENTPMVPAVDVHAAHDAMSIVAGRARSQQEATRRKPAHARMTDSSRKLPDQPTTRNEMRTADALLVPVWTEFKGSRPVDSSARPAAPSRQDASSQPAASSRHASSRPAAPSRNAPSSRPAASSWNAPSSRPAASSSRPAASSRSAKPSRPAKPSSRAPPGPATDSSSSAVPTIRAPPRGQRQNLAPPLYPPPSLRENGNNTSPSTPTNAFEGFDEVCGAARRERHDELDRAAFAQATAGVEF